LGGGVKSLSGSQGTLKKKKKIEEERKDTHGSPTYILQKNKQSNRVEKEISINIPKESALIRWNQRLRLQKRRLPSFFLFRA